MLPNEIKHGWRGYLWIYAPLIIWVGVIFLLSSPKGSMSETSLIFGPILKFLFPDMSDAGRQVVHGYIRKCAHFTEYAVLSLFAIRALVMTGWTWRNLLAYAIPIGLVTLVAGSDEFNQSFEVSRTSSIWDVALDVLGGTCGTLLSWLYVRRWQKRSVVRT